LLDGAEVQNPQQRGMGGCFRQGRKREGSKKLSGVLRRGGSEGVANGGVPTTFRKTDGPDQPLHQNFKKETGITKGKRLEKKRVDLIN